MPAPRVDPYQLRPLTLGPATPPGEGQKEPPTELGSGDLLTEVDERSPEWLAGIVRRMLAMTAQPVMLDTVTGLDRIRWEAAGVPVVAEDADPSLTRARAWPAWQELSRADIGYGSSAPRLVVIGERVTRAGQLPFAGRTGVWLWLALRRLGWDELVTYVTNAEDSRQRPWDERLGAVLGALRRSDPVVLALGDHAHAAVNRLGVTAVKAWNPQYHAKWHRKDGPEGYAAKLREAGLRPGPGVALPKERAERLPTLPTAYGLRSFGFAPGDASPVKSPAGRRELSRADAERARRAFIMGQVRVDGTNVACRTLRDVADALGLDYVRLAATSRRQDWQSARFEHERELTDRIRREAIEQEVRSYSRARGKAWAITDRYLSELALALTATDEDGKPKPAVKIDPFGAEALVRATLALADAKVEPGDVTDEVSRMTPQARAQEYLRDMVAKFGPRALEQLREPAPAVEGVEGE